MKTLETHNAQIQEISKHIATYFAGSRVKRLRFNHGSTVQLKRRESEEYFSVDISLLNDILEINEEEHYALVEPNVPLNQLISQTLEAGLVPPVVPELPGITCGGAVIGGAGESSSYKVRLFDDNCFEYEIVLGNGEVITASNTHNSDLFYALPWSYGTLGLLSLIKLKLVPAKPYVHLRYCSFETYDDAISCMKQESHTGEHTFLNARAMFDAVQKLNLTRSFFIHDYVTDFDAAADLIAYADRIVGIYPIWLCPIRTFHATEKISPTNVSREGIVLDIAIYGRSKKYTADKLGTNNKIERYATAHKSMKVLYSEVFYPEDEFWTLYDKAGYTSIRRKYHAEEVFTDLWHKVRSQDTIKPTLFSGIPKLLLETVLGTYKNV